MKDGKKFESDEFMRTTEDEKMRQTLIPGRRDGRQWVAGRGVSSFRMCHGQTDKVRSHRVEEMHKGIPVTAMPSSLLPSFPALIFAAGGERRREIEWQK